MIHVLDIADTRDVVDAKRSLGTMRMMLIMNYIHAHDCCNANTVYIHIYGNGIR